MQALIIMTLLYCMHKYAKLTIPVVIVYSQYNPAGIFSDDMEEFTVDVDAVDVWTVGKDEVSVII